MVSNGKRWLVALGVVALLSSGGQAVGEQQAPAPPGNWVGTWAAAPSAALPNTESGYPNYSIRNIVHTSIGGSQVRVRLSNAFGRAPVLFGQVTVALAAGADTPNAVPGTMRTLTFGGEREITAPPFADVLSDPVALTVPPDANLLVTTFTPDPSGPVTYHSLTMQNSYFTRNGNHAAAESGSAFTEQTRQWHYVSGVDVRAPGVRGSVVALGDSITDGANSTWGANLRWPDQLADRMKAGPAHLRLGVLNAGISGNRLLLDGGSSGVNALARLDRDVLTATGARTVIVFEGINDIQQTPHQTDPNRIIAALKQIAQRAKDRGLRVLGATITPFKGWRSYSEQLEATRQAVNRYIRNNTDYDGLIDFDATIRDPQDPQRIKPEYDQGDHLHPGDAGFKAMANAINLSSL
ncbi:SGNH/GDSL hydrolase family protein [Crossiella sp. SN42]|uniref:SGNH/GDSL hydrolase family protein n=1 Tax=Crossiella sp. SN42 TaxID=2944808 RepID=UPI00207D715E|nr:SGNH/GDSL hydrolase family protein [Crossiella sp. SN42]MCO1579507.1 SGNH/GDSL hydrolase family protein [Crossiella sp. SN42]